MLEPDDKEIFESVQSKWGVDLELIREMRSLSLEERFERYRRAAESVLWLKRAREQANNDAC